MAHGLHRSYSSSSLLDRTLSDSPPPSKALLLTVLGRRGEARSWLRVTPDGAVARLLLDKHEVARRCAVPVRDLRLLEGSLVATSATALLPRERAIVVSLDYVKAIVTHSEVLSPDSTDLDDVRSHATQQLAAFKCPEALLLVDALPKTATDKVAKNVLRDRLAEPDARVEQM